MARDFHIRLTGDFLGPDGKPVLWQDRFEPLEAAAATHDFIAEHRPEVGADQVTGADALLVLTPKITAETVRDAHRLKVVARWGVGYDSVDVAACTANDVAVTITKGAVNHPVAESIVTFMLALSHHLLAKDKLVREARWGDRAAFHGTEIREKTLGVVGLGGIGGTTVKLLSSFGMAQPLAYDPYLPEGDLRAAGVRPADLSTVLREADFVIVTCPLTAETRHLIGAEQLALMKPSAYLINTARGGIVDEAALAEALRARRIRGAALDVFAREPADESNPFRDLDNVLLTPHAICWTEECFRDIGRMAVASMMDVAAGRKPHGLLNPEVWERPGFQAKLREA